MKGNWLNLSDEDIKTIVKEPAETLQELVKRQNEESYQLGKKHGAIEELEKIKAEFYKCRDYIICNHNHTEMDMNKLDGIVLAIAITDERISELKGENNG